MEYAAKLAYCYILAQILLYICKYAAQLSVLKDILARYAGIFGIIGQQLAIYKPCSRRISCRDR